MPVWLPEGSNTLLKFLLRALTRIHKSISEILLEEMRTKCSTVYTRMAKFAR